MADLTLPALHAPNWLSLDDQSLNEGVRQAFTTPMHRERWKYTKPQTVLDLLDQPLDSPIIEGAEQTGIEIQRLSRDDNDAALLALPRDWVFNCEAYAAIGRAEQALLIHVTESPEQPLRFTFSAACAPIIVRVSNGASLTVIEQSDGDVPQQQSLWILQETNSHLIHSRHNVNPAQHWQYLNVQLGKDASYSLHNHAIASSLRRQDIQLQLTGEGASVKLLGAGFTSAEQVLDQQITVQHQAPHTTSNQQFHHIVDDHGKVNFSGRIHIHDNAGASNAQLSNKNLGLGQLATINTKPELEIYTDDVQCAHGATVGQLDDQQLFYFASRGIGSEQARQMLSQAFLFTCIDGPDTSLARDAFSQSLAST